MDLQQMNLCYLLNWRSKSMTINASNGVCNGKAIPGPYINLFHWSGLNQCDLHLFSVYFWLGLNNLNTNICSDTIISLERVSEYPSYLFL